MGEVRQLMTAVPVCPMPSSVMTPTQTTKPMVKCPNGSLPADGVAQLDLMLLATFMHQIVTLMKLHSPLNVELVLSPLLPSHAPTLISPAQPVSSPTLRSVVVFMPVMPVSSVHLCWPIQRVLVATLAPFHCSLMTLSRLPCLIWVDLTLVIQSLVKDVTPLVWTSTDTAETPTLVSVATSQTMSSSINLTCHHKRTVTSLTPVSKIK